ncbi:MAG: sulfatase [Spirochaetota bacterium]
MDDARPNILHIFTDMQRFDTIRALGNPVIRTPNLDLLCAEGTAFTSAYSPCPVCIPARCSMIYGQYPMHTACYENTEMPTDGRQSFMDALVAAGYSTHGIGKCHFTPDPYAARGFQSREVQEELGVGEGELHRNHYMKYLAERGYTYLSEVHGIRGEMYYTPQPSQLPAKDHPTQWIGDRSVAHIREQAENTQPWYLFASFIHPHPPLAPPVPWHKLYRAPMMNLPALPPDYESLLTYINHAQNRYKYRDQGIDKNLARTIIAYYYACISFVDFQIGRMLSALEETGQLESTLVVFTSDHGELLGDYGCYGKRSMHDGSARIPLILRLPGRFEGGSRCDTPVSLVDIAPTLLGVGGAEITSHHLDGEDLQSIATGRSQRETVFAQISFNRFDMAKATEGRAALVAQNYSSAEEIAAYSSYMIVSNDWKYVYSAPDDREFLFDRRRDPGETRNRVGSPFAANALKHHKATLFQWLRDGGETAGLAETDWRAFPRHHVDSDPDTGLLVQDEYAYWTDMSIPGYTDVD